MCRNNILREIDHLGSEFFFDAYDVIDELHGAVAFDQGPITEVYPWPTEHALIIVLTALLCYPMLIPVLADSHLLDNCVRCKSSTTHRVPCSAHFLRMFDYVSRSGVNGFVQKYFAVLVKMTSWCSLNGRRRYSAGWFLSFRPRYQYSEPLLWLGESVPLRDSPAAGDT
jgi:hypothetical protein